VGGSIRKNGEDGGERADMIKHCVRKRRSTRKSRERNPDADAPAVKRLCVDLRVERDLRRASCALRFNNYPSGTSVRGQIDRASGQHVDDKREERGRGRCQGNYGVQWEGGQELGAVM
jgi:hypothetical protein